MSADGAGPRVVVDEALPGAAQRFAAFGPVEPRPAAAIVAPLPPSLRLLILRSVTRVDDALLDGATGLRFVGSATSGVEHIDVRCLRQRGIAWAAAPGCNAEAVVDYVLSVLCHQLPGFPSATPQLTVGIVGCGHSGDRLRRRLEALGLRCLICDPLRAAELPSRPLAELLAAADAISLHLPLSDGNRHLIGAEALAQLRSGALLINSARGALIDSEALLRRSAAPGAPRLALDTWEGEPAIDSDLLACVHLATPHIAGHTASARRRALALLYEAACQHLGAPDPSALSSAGASGAQTAAEPAPVIPAVEPLCLRAEDAQNFPVLLQRLSAHCCPLEELDRQLRTLLAATPDDTAQGFAAARAAPPPRLEFSELPLLAQSLPLATQRMLRAAGFLQLTPSLPAAK